MIDALLDVGGPPIAAVLASIMSQISEHYYCAGWLDELEFELWTAVTQAPKPYRFGMGDISQREIAALRILSDAAGGWIMWKSGANGEKYGADGSGEGFVSIAEWETIYAEWKRRKDAQSDAGTSRVGPARSRGPSRS